MIDFAVQLARNWCPDHTGNPCPSCARFADAIREALGCAEKIVRTVGCHSDCLAESPDQHLEDCAIVAADRIAKLRGRA